MTDMQILEEKHMISILMYISDNEGCMKTDIYKGVSQGRGMPWKLQTLEDGGLIRSEGQEDRLMRRFYLTNMGRRASEVLRDLDNVMKGRSR